MKKVLLALIFVAALVVSGCSRESTQPEPAQPQPENTPMPPADTPVPPEEPPVAPTEIAPATPAPTEAPADLPPAADPMRIEFESEDGRQLVGTFYPGDGGILPVVVLMHEGLGDRSQMEPLALWMQNRPDEVSSGESALFWMPAFPPSIGSVAVLTFDMRGHGESEGPMPPNDQPLEYLMDARAAIALAKTLEGVDPNRIVVIGASMFAEAGLNACIALEGAAILPDQPGNGCVASLSLSPFNFYGIPFDQAAETFLKTLEDSVVWCLHAEDDYKPETCRAIEGLARARAIIYSGDTHGVAFIKAGLNPDFGDIMVEFLISALVRR